MLPLPREKNLKSITSTGNQGLFYNKFFNQWEDNFKKVKEPSANNDGGKAIWIDRFKELTNDGAPSARRIADLAVATGGTAKTLITTGPFITGMGLSHPVENGFLWHHTLGVPYLPGSSIKGMIRAWACDWCGIEKDEDGYDKHIDEIACLFGGPVYEKLVDENGKEQQKEIRPASAGNIIIFDALPVKPVKLFREIITPHDGGWRIAKNPTESDAPADWISPNPISFLAIQEGAEFQFAIAPRRGADEGDMDKAWRYLSQALEWIGAGAKTAVGFGRFEDAPDSWAIGDKAILELAGGMDVVIENLDADGVPQSVKNIERGQVIKITDPSLLHRP